MSGTGALHANKICVRVQVSKHIISLWFNMDIQKNFIIIIIFIFIIISSDTF
jgi:hypothetical protein